MLQNIVFSYNRAMQLECFLDSFLKHFKNIHYQIAVVFHTSGAHSEGYKLLRKKYRNNEKLRFYERKEARYYLLKILPLLFKPTNLYHYFKFKYLRKNVDDFKFLVEDIIRRSKAEFVMFSTDDTYYDNDVVLNELIQNKIKNEPDQQSYRLFLGKNIFQEYNPKIQEQNDIILWNYYENNKIKGWGYPFTVDGTIYDSKVILKVLKKLIYHMPATLESYVATFATKRRLFSKGICPKTSCLSNIWINRVQKIGFHKSADIDVEFLNRRFLEGYKIEYQYSKPVKEWGFIPENVILKNPKTNDVIPL